MISISQVLLFRNSETSHELGRALWAALVEIEAFYNLDEPRATFSRTYLSDSAPEALAGEIPPFWKARSSTEGPDSLWRHAKGQYARTFDYRKIVEGVSLALEGAGRSAPYLILTDQELTPPPDWRYIIFDGDERGVVVSTAPADPNYWRDRNPSRISMIKHRVRTAGLTAVGGYLGLQRCDNSSCFLYSPIESVSCLDAMVQLCPAHGLPDLVGRGFRVIVNEPDAPQPIESGPTPLETA
jgi:hypothetical protein